MNQSVLNCVLTVCVCAFVPLPERSPHRLVVHIWFVFVFAPKPGDGLRVDQLEDPLVRVRPFNVARTDFAVLQQLHQELPQVQRVSSWGAQTGRKSLF